jgi:heterodisulfide reductase subunit A
MKEPKIGVYICHCGGNISDTVDVAKVKENISKLKGVEIAQTYEYMCSKPGQDMIQRDIKEHGLNRVIVASCSPRMHLDTFRGAVKGAGVDFRGAEKKAALNPYLLDMANIREQCSWVHDNKELATEKATALIQGEVERVKHNEPLEPKTMPVNRDVAVIGGGIAGILASIELADKGYQVYLVERNPSIGGHMAQLSKTFPTLDCSACILTPKMVYVSQHPKIKIIDMAEPIAVNGSPGNYQVTLRVRPRFVDKTKCLSCGECAKVCPVKKTNQFEEGLAQEKAIHIPFKQAIPSSYVIDKDACLFFTKGVCRVCEKFCKADAIVFDQKEETVELNVGAIVACTGYQQLDHKLSKEIFDGWDVFSPYSYGLHPDIVTNLQFERLMLQGIHRPSNGKPPKKVAFLLCVGSRMDRGIEYCCKIGCMNAIKHSLLLLKALPDAEAWIFYTDIRAHGKGYEEFYSNARNHNVRFIRGRAAEVVPNGDRLIVKAEDTVLGKQIEEDFDLVVLSPALLPNSGTGELAKMMGVDVGPDGFLLERHHKLRPVDTKMEGMYLAGCALGPKDIRETTVETMATASKVATFLGKGEVSVSPEKAFIIPEKCNSCGECIQYCPAKAIEKTSKGVTINSISCTGCGVCVPKCPTEAIDLKHSTDAQLLAQIHGTSEVGDDRPRIIAFLEKTTAYGSADLAGQSRVGYTPNVRIISVPSTGRVGLKHVLHAFAYGADGIVFIEGDDSPFREEGVRDHVNQLKREISKFGVESLRLASITTTLPQYDKVVNLFETLNERLTKMGRIPEEKRQKIIKALAGGD